MNRLTFVDRCPTCGSADPDLRRFVHDLESGYSDDSPVCLWDLCPSPWHSLACLPLDTASDKI